jgi:6-pyruvoyl-tetrahydropterin synthase
MLKPAWKRACERRFGAGHYIIGESMPCDLHHGHADIVAAIKTGMTSERPQGHNVDSSFHDIAAGLDHRYWNQ